MYLQHQYIHLCKHPYKKVKTKDSPKAKKKKKKKKKICVFRETLLYVTSQVKPSNCFMFSKKKKTDGTGINIYASYWDKEAEQTV